MQKSANQASNYFVLVHLPEAKNAQAQAHDKATDFTASGSILDAYSFSTK